MNDLMVKLIRIAGDKLLENGKPMYSQEHMLAITGYFDKQMNKLVNDGCGDCNACDLVTAMTNRILDLVALIGQSNREFNAKATRDVLLNIATACGTFVGSTTDSKLSILLVDQFRNAFFKGMDDGLKIIEDFEAAKGQKPYRDPKHNYAEQAASADPYYATEQANKPYPYRTK